MAEGVVSRLSRLPRRATPGLALPCLTLPDHGTPRPPQRTPVVGGVSSLNRGRPQVHYLRGHRVVLISALITLGTLALLRHIFR
jgi:hypothetical protein